MYSWWNRTMAGMPAFSISPHTQSKRPSSSGWRRTSVWKVKRMPIMPFCFLQVAIWSRAPGTSGSKRPMMQKRSGWLAAASSATSLRSPSHDGGTMTTPSTPALSISARSSSLPSGARCGSARAGHGRTGVLAAQMCTWASTIFMLPPSTPTERGARPAGDQPHAEPPEPIDKRHHHEAGHAEAAAHGRALDRQHDEPVDQRDDDAREQHPSQHAAQGARQARYKERGDNPPQAAPEGRRHDGRHAPRRHGLHVVDPRPGPAQLGGEPEAELVEDQDAQRTRDESDDD